MALWTDQKHFRIGKWETLVDHSVQYRRSFIEDTEYGLILKIEEDLDVIATRQGEP